MASVVNKIRMAPRALAAFREAVQDPDPVGKVIRKYNLPKNMDLIGPGGWHAGPKKVIVPQIQEDGFFELHSHLYFTTHSEGAKEIVHFGANGVEDPKDLVLIDFVTERTVTDEENPTFGTRYIPVEADVYVKAIYDISEEHQGAIRHPKPLMQVLRTGYRAAMEVFRSTN